MPAKLYNFLVPRARSIMALPDNSTWCKWVPCSHTHTHTHTPHTHTHTPSHYDKIKAMLAKLYNFLVPRARSIMALSDNSTWCKWVPIFVKYMYYSVAGYQLCCEHGRVRSSSFVGVCSILCLRSAERIICSAFSALHYIPCVAAMCHPSAT